MRPGTRDLMTSPSPKGVWVYVMLVLAAFAIVIPVAAAIIAAYYQSYAAQAEKAEMLAREVLRRADFKREEMRRGFAALERLKAAPCSAAGIQAMANVALGLDQYQGTGYIRGNRLICTSAGPLPQPVDLGPPGFGTSTGYWTRTHIKLPFAPDTPMNIVSIRSGFALFTHPRFVTDVAIDEQREGAAVILLQSRGVVSLRGRVDLRNLDPYFQSEQHVYKIDGRIIAVVPSRDGIYAGVVSLSMGEAHRNFLRYLLFLLPIGLLCAGLLVFLMRAIFRMENSFSTIARRALKSDQFYMHYQPIVDLQTGHWVGAEALVRWRRNGVNVRPDLFVPLMEEAGLIHILTDRVFALVAQDAGSRLRHCPDFHVAINIAAPDLREHHLEDLVDGLVATAACRYDQIVLEITERSLIDTADCRQRLEALRGRGVRIALDDFGTGYSSLSYLQNLPVDIIKIDRSFVETIGTTAPTSSVVRHIINIARDLGTTLVAEGVETDAQEQFLRERGVQFAQGWRFARSMRWRHLAAELELRNAASEGAADASSEPRLSSSGRR